MILNASLYIEMCTSVGGPPLSGLLLENLLEMSILRT